MILKDKRRKQQNKPNNYFGGIVKAVPSADVIYIYLTSPLSKTCQFSPIQYGIILQGIRTPQVRNKGKDEQEWFFESREFLRNLIIGQPVYFELTSPDFGHNRYFGKVYTEQGRDIREILLENGWAETLPRPNKINGRNSDHSLVLIHQRARENQLGMFSQTVAPFSRSVSIKFDAVEIFSTFADRPVDAVVEQVRNGSTYRIYLLKEHLFVIVSLAGVKAPFYKFDQSIGTQQPFAATSVYFSELHFMHRTVQVILTSIDKSNTLYADIFYNGTNIAEYILEQGLAQYVHWNAGKSSPRLLRAQSKAEAKQLRIWADSTTKSNQSMTNKRPSRYWGKVVDIINPGLIQILQYKDGSKGHVLGDRIKVSLSSLIAPRYIPRDRLKFSDEMDVNEILLAYDAREYLRNTLVGKTVSYTLDYVRPETKKDGHVIQERVYCTVVLNNRNIAIDLVSNGYVQVVNHREIDKRSPDYQLLILAELTAKKQSIGIHSNVPRKLPHVSILTMSLPFNDEKEGDRNEDELINANDAMLATLSAPAVAANKPQKASFKMDSNQISRLQHFLRSFQNANSIKAVVESVYSAIRFKIWIEKEMCLIPFALLCSNSVKSVQFPLSPEDVALGKQIQNESLNYVRDLCYQHDVTIIIDSITPRGSFLGTMEIDGVDLITLLLKKGYASLHSLPKNNRNIPTQLYKKIENEAKASKLGIWTNWDQRAVNAARQARAQEAMASSQVQAKNVILIKVTTIFSGIHFYYELQDEAAGPLFAAMTDQLNSSPDENLSDQSVNIQVGQMVMSRFSVDNNWYRACVETIEDDQYHVFYSDYGNREIVTRNQLRPLPSQYSLSNIPANAHEAYLAYLELYDANSQYSQDAAKLFNAMVSEKQVLANIQYYKNNVPYLILGDTVDQLTINGELLRNGLAFISKAKQQSNGNINILRDFIQIQNQAKEMHLGIWEYGDILDSDDGY